jgi:transcriptional regulator
VARTDPSLTFLKGTVDMLVLKSISWGPMHGFGIALWLEQQSSGSLGMDDAAMYQVLHRLEGRGFVDAQWKTTENNRRARFYRLTAAGRAHLLRETHSWLQYSRAVTAIMTLRVRPGTT